MKKSPATKSRPRKKRTEAGPFSISVTIGTTVVSSEGSSMYEALKALPTPPKLLVKSLLFITDGVRSHKQMLMPVKTKRLFFTSDSTKIVVAKQLSTLLR